MKASNVLDNLCMEKVAARRYRDAKGNPISAQELIDSHGGLKYVASNGEKIEKNLNRLKGMGLLAQTGDGKYKVREVSDKRVNMVREPYALNNSNEFDAKKALKQISSFKNTTQTGELNTGKPLFQRKKKYTRTNKRVNKRNLPSGRIPEIILGTALLTAAGAKAYDSISKRKDKKEGEKNERK